MVQEDSDFGLIIRLPKRLLVSRLPPNRRVSQNEFRFDSSSYRFNSPHSESYAAHHWAHHGSLKRSGLSTGQMVNWAKGLPQLVTTDSSA